MSDDKNETKKELVDSELDDLLDSALQDMTKKDDKMDNKSGGPLEDAQNPQNMWSEEFIKEAASQFEANMAAILGSFSGIPEEQITQEQIAQTFTKMAEAAAQVLNQKPGENGTDETAGSGESALEPDRVDEVTAAISQTLQNLSTNAENLQTPFTDQDLANMFNNFNLEGGQEGNMFVPFMQGMMQSLLSKEVLYPSLKELVDKYPVWLQENKGKIEQADHDRYTQQMELMKKVCEELEPEQESDPEDVKRKRFETVLELMQKMQDLGQPPTELVGDMGSAPTGFMAPNNQEQGQCNIM